MSVVANTPQVSILVKALNEESNIAACLEAALSEAASVAGEVILVDSLSTDRTVEIARCFPVRIVQFLRAADCGCGAAVQLGYQYARGTFIYVLDGDMILQSGFLSFALSKLRADPTLAGVGGRLIDTRLTNAADHKRMMADVRLCQAVDVDELGGGGLYRRDAIESVGYLAHRWLPAFEEAELGVRLRAVGWRLVRFPYPSVVHTGHHETNWEMLSRLWRSQRAQATGMFLRLSCGTRWWWRAWRKQWYVFAALGLHCVAFLMAFFFVRNGGFSWWPSFLIAEGSVWLVMLHVMAWRKRSIRWAAFTLFSWHYFGVAAFVGVFQRLPDARTPIVGRVLA